MRKVLLTYCLLLISASWLSSQTNASLSIDKEEIKIGEQIEVLLEVSFPVTESYSLPTLNDTITGSIEIVSSGKIDTTFGGDNLSQKILSQKLLITSFDSGYHAIPPLVFPGKSDSLRSSPNLIHVRDVEVEMPQQPAQGEAEIEIKDIKDIRNVDFSIWEWIKLNYHWLLLGALLTAGIWYYLKYIHPKLMDKGVEAIVPKKIVPPHLIAIEKLKKIEDQKLWQSGEIKAYHSAVSEIVREYIENELKIPALESTTVEIMEALKETSIDNTLQQELFEMLQLSDLVKFAKMKPIGEENEKSLNRAYGFVNKTKPSENTEDNQEEKTLNV